MTKEKVDDSPICDLHHFNVWLQLKDKGNTLFKQQDYQNALNSYRSAIEHIYKVYHQVEQKSTLVESQGIETSEPNSVDVIEDESDEESDDGVPAQPHKAQAPIHKRQVDVENAFDSTTKTALSVLHGNIATCKFKMVLKEWQLLCRSDFRVGRTG
jgi:hypothetical protein